jgi:hypothetical protein
LPSSLIAEVSTLFTAGAEIGSENCLVVIVVEIGLTVVIGAVTGSVTGAGLTLITGSSKVGFITGLTLIIGSFTGAGLIIGANLHVNDLPSI